MDRPDRPDRCPVCDKKNWSGYNCCADKFYDCPVANHLWQALIFERQQDYKLGPPYKSDACRREYDNHVRECKDCKRPTKEKF